MERNFLHKTHSRAFDSSWYVAAHAMMTFDRIVVHPIYIYAHETIISMISQNVTAYFILQSLIESVLFQSLNAKASSISTCFSTVGTVNETGSLKPFSTILRSHRINSDHLSSPKAQSSSPTRSFRLADIFPDQTDKENSRLMTHQSRTVMYCWIQHPKLTTTVPNICPTFA